jgi:hypothetical protein
MLNQDQNYGPVSKETKKKKDGTKKKKQSITKKKEDPTIKTPRHSKYNPIKLT